MIQSKKFNKKQIAKCKVCKHASGNVNHPTKIGWCGKYRVRIDDPAKQSSIILPGQQQIIQPGQPLPMPSLIQQGKNFASASARHVASGMKTRTLDEAARCIAICTGSNGSPKCEFFDAARQRCSKCGCYMKVKSRWATANCPIGKW